MVSRKKKSLREGLQDFSFDDCNSCFHSPIDWACLHVCAEEEMRQAVISEDRVVAHFFCHWVYLPIIRKSLSRIRWGKKYRAEAKIIKYGIFLKSRVHYIGFLLYIGQNAYTKATELPVCHHGTLLRDGLLLVQELIVNRREISILFLDSQTTKGHFIPFHHFH